MGTKRPADAGQLADANGVVDAGMRSDGGDVFDGGTSATDDAGGAPPSLRFERVVSEAIHQTTENGGVWVYSASGGEMRVSVENYEGLGGLAAPGLRNIGAAEADYAQCGVCVVVETECTSQGCGKVFMPEVAGRVTFTQLGTAEGQRLAGSLEGLVLREVTIDRSNYETVDVIGGARYAMDTLVWDEAIAPPVCSGHGHVHGATCHCDPGYHLDPADRTRCLPN